MHHFNGSCPYKLPIYSPLINKHTTLHITLLLTYNVLYHSQITYQTFRHANHYLCHFSFDLQNWAVFGDFNKIVNMFQKFPTFYRRS
ncbi:hypothetical protein Hdeb2414_s0082g00781151 [Helianthus debilis subsp. tardiflorus]